MSTMVDNEGTYEVPKKTFDSSTQATKIMKHQLLLNEVSKIPTKISKIHFVSPKETKKISADKTEPKSLMKLRKDIQNLIDFQSPRIGLIEFPTNAFSKHIHISQNLQLITLDGEPIPELMLCKKCKQVRARCRLTATPMLRHLKLHEQFETAHKIDKKKKGKKNNNSSLYASCLIHAMKKSLPISNRAEEGGESLPRNIRQDIRKMVLSEGDPEEQITFYKNLKRNLWNKINLENSEQKKKELFKELKYLEFIYSAARDAVREKAPVAEHRIASSSSCLEPKSNQGTNLEENAMPIPPANANITSISDNLEAGEMNEDGGIEIISIASVENENSIKSSSLIAENEIKLEINND